MKIRMAKKEDAEGMLKIYAPFILHSGITQETELPSVENFQQRIISTLEERPWLVCEAEGEIAGYAYAGKHRDRKGYQWCVETSVYIHERFYRLGAARALYYALIEILKVQDYVNVYAVITLPNDKSVTFHEGFGFSYFTTYKKIGYKLGKWHDVGWWYLQINPPVINPAKPKKISSVDDTAVLSILEKAAAYLKK